MLPTTTIATSIEQTVNNLAARLMEGPSRQQKEQQEATAALASMGQQPGSSVSGFLKGNGQSSSENRVMQRGIR